MQTAKCADAALQYSALTLFIPCSRPTRLNRSPWIIQKEIFKMSDRISYIYTAELQYKSQNLHHNKNLRKGINGTGKYAVKQLPSLILGVYMCHWLGSAFLLPKLARSIQSNPFYCVLPLVTPCLVLPPIGFEHVHGLHAENDSRRVIPHCYPHSSLPAGSYPFSRSCSQPIKNLKTVSAFLQWSVTARKQTSRPPSDNGGCCCFLTWSLSCLSIPLSQPGSWRTWFYGYDLQLVLSNWGLLILYCFDQAKSDPICVPGHLTFTCYFCYIPERTLT